MKRELHSPDSISKKNSNLGNFYEWIQEIICLANQEWSPEFEQITKFTTELIHNQSSSCAMYNITKFDYILHLINQCAIHYPNYSNVLAVTRQTVESLIIRNDLNKALIKEYAVAFNLLFKKRWQLPFNNYATPLQSSVSFIDLIFNHGYNIFLFIKSCYDMNTNTNSRILFGFLAYVLQEMYFSIPHTIPVSILINQCTASQQETVNKHPNNQIVAYLFIKWDISCDFIPQFHDEFNKCKDLVPTWFSSSNKGDYTPLLYKFNQTIQLLFNNSSELGMDIYAKPCRLIYSQCPNTRLLKFNKAAPPNRNFRSNDTFNSSSSVNMDKFKSTSTNITNSNDTTNGCTSTVKTCRPVRQLLQLLPRLSFDISAINEYPEFTNKLHDIQSKYQDEHHLINFPIIGFVCTFINHCNHQNIMLTNKLLDIMATVLFDIWHSTMTNTFGNSTAYSAWNSHPMEFIYSIPVIQTSNYYTHTVKQINESFIDYHSKRHADAFPECIEVIFTMMKQEYLLVGIWQQPELFNTFALYNMSKQDNSDGARAKEMLGMMDEEMEVLYNNQQDIYSSIRTSMESMDRDAARDTAKCNWSGTTCSLILDYVPSEYTNLDSFIMYIFMCIIEEGITATRLMMENVNNDFKIKSREEVTEILTRFVAIIILKEDRFRMMDYRDMRLMIMCGLYGICKYMDLKLSLADCIGAMESSQMAFNKQSLYMIYDKTLQNNEIIYCDLIVFFNTHFVPTFGNLIRHFSKTVMLLNVGRDAGNDGFTI
eukprot:NODE_303_length_11391_cov_0.177028.p1 type:complete len:765 gc:universal NODE_303_length_11391_cov_0.177028:4083-6377(+)